MFIFVLCSTLIGAACASYATRRSVPRLPVIAALVLGVATLALPVVLLSTRMSVFTGTLSALVLWMIALPLVAAWRAVAARRAGAGHA